LAKELDTETKKRQDAEEAYEQLKEQYIRMELEASREKSEMQARMDTLEADK
jgi:hypothetical protein